MPKRAPPESAVGATVDSTVAKHISAMIGSDTKTSAALDIFVVTATTYHGDSDLDRGHAHPVNKHALLRNTLPLEVQATSRFQ